MFQSQSRLTGAAFAVPALAYGAMGLTAFYGDRVGE